MKTPFKKGMTLVEMLVAIVIISLTMIGFTLFLSSIWRTQGFILETGIASMVATRGVSNTIRYVREAVESDAGQFPVVYASTTEFEFYVDYDKDGVVEKLRYFVDSNAFNVGVVDPTNDAPPQYYDVRASGHTECSGLTGEEECDQVANFVVNDIATNAVFTYYDEFNIEILPDGTGVVPTGNIRLVEILLHVNPTPDRAPENVIINSAVHIRNLSNFGEAPT